MKVVDPDEGLAPNQRIAKLIAQQTDWRGPMLARLRGLILSAAPGITEEWKWDSPVWSQTGLVCAAGIFKDHVKLNFFKGAYLPDPMGLFNAGLDAKGSRAVDFFEGVHIEEAAIKDLVHAAIASNKSGRTGGGTVQKKPF